MRERELAVLKQKLAKLTRSQRKALAAELVSEDRKAMSVEVIEGHGGQAVACPHCAEAHVVKNGNAHGLQRYKCRGCGKTFNVLTGTPLAGLHMKGKWLEQVAVLRDGATLTQAMARMNVARTTALRWRHRFLAAPKTVQAHVLGGITETDETFFLYSNKGQRGGLGRKSRRRGGKASKRGLSKEQVPVLVARDRSGATADFILDADDAPHVTTALTPILSLDAILCTDGSRTLAVAAKALGVEHHAVNLSAGVRVIGPYHVQNVNAYDSRLKEWLHRFHGVSTKYLDSYLGWFRAIDRSPGKRLQPTPFLTMAAMA